MPCPGLHRFQFRCQHLDFTVSRFIPRLCPRYHLRVGQRGKAGNQVVFGLFRLPNCTFDSPHFGVISGTERCLRLLPGGLVNRGRLQTLQQQAVNHAIHDTSLDVPHVGLARVIGQDVLVLLRVGVPGGGQHLVRAMREIVGENQVAVGWRLTGALGLVVAHPGAIRYVVRIWLALEVGGRQAVIGIHEQVERNDRLVVVPARDHLPMDPMSDIGHVGQKVFQPTSARHKLSGDGRIVVDVALPQKPFWDHVQRHVGEARAAGFDVAPGLVQVPVVGAKQHEISQHHIRPNLEFDVLAVIGIARPIWQRFPHIDHEAGRDLAPGVQAAFGAIVPRLDQPAFDVKFKVVCCPLHLLPKHLDVETALCRVRKIIDEGRREYQHVMAAASVDEDIRLDLRHFAEKPIYVLRRHRADLTTLNQVEHGRHARAFFDPFCPADAAIQIDHLDTFPYPAELFQMFDHIDGLERGRDIADLCLRGLAVVHSDRSVNRQGLGLVRV